MLRSVSRASTHGQETTGDKASRQKPSKILVYSPTTNLGAAGTFPVAGTSPARATALGAAVGLGRRPEGAVLRQPALRPPPSEHRECAAAVATPAAAHIQRFGPLRVLHLEGYQRW